MYCRATLVTVELEKNERIRRDRKNLLRNLLEFETIATMKSDERHISGEEIFGSPLPDDLREHEVYEPSDVNFIRVLQDTGHLVSGGPEIDLEKLKSLKKSRRENPEAAGELREILRFETWYRCNYVLNKISDDKTRS